MNEYGLKSELPDVWWQSSISDFNNLCEMACEIYGKSHKSGLILYQYGWKSELPDTSIGSLLYQIPTESLNG